MRFRRYAALGLALRPVGSLTTPSLLQGRTVMSSPSWLPAAEEHAKTLTDLLYPLVEGEPDGGTLKSRMHAVKRHPIFNFLHYYYRYSAADLSRYSPGVLSAEPLLFESDDQLELLHPRFRHVESSTVRYSAPPLAAEGRFGWIQLSKTRDVLKFTSIAKPHIFCFGRHEWAMLYKKHEKKQTALSLRVPQAVIDEVVESGISCTHFDAFRHFAPEAKPFNTAQLTREEQEHHEQPACIHASMDLFKAAYKVYPLTSSDLLQRCLRLGLKARFIDMRASPYEVSNFCGTPIRIETAEGRKEYAELQMELAKDAAPLRKELLDVYTHVLDTNKPTS